ncbi:4-hydroxybenzoate geranyltransferase [Lithospermum erythrorhizon]|uniref:4-hydroxybenzoate polyprenyltransferase, mitochondrial n=1 Tax=Lithospermum erythrorhizon TaxID=34254 RepID=A0A515L547_LITER|nr:4-hydroxybenzoate geranyltransferase-like protein 16 [Lithospermum erythrorhizon]
MSSTKQTMHKKGKQPSWIDLHLPEIVKPYAHLARLDKPIGSWLLAWPAFWSVALATDLENLPKMLAIFGWWAVWIRGAGCTINDYFDRDYDKKVERTKSRPLASGSVSPTQGLWWLGIQVFMGLGVLYQSNILTLALAILHVPLVFAYPLMKRITYWPQAFLGVMISWGALLGPASLQGTIVPKIAYPLYISSFFWTLIYDTIYAHQDKEDDSKAGVKSTALRFGDSTKVWITWFTVGCIGALVVGGVALEMGLAYYVFVAMGTVQLAWQIITVDLDSPIDCGRKFVSNQWFGAIIFCGIVQGRLFS